MSHDRARRFDLVVFDLDGTLVDSAPDIASALNATLRQAGCPPLSFAEAKALIGDGAPKLIERALPPAERGRDIAPLLAHFLAYYGDHLCDETRPYPGVEALVDALRAAGVATAVLTNKSGRVARAVLQALSLADRFQAVIGDGDGFPRKPDPTAARALIARLGCSAERTVVLGDGLPDLRLARAVPCGSIAAGWGYVSAAAHAAEDPTHLAPTPEAARAFILG